MSGTKSSNGPSIIPRILGASWHGFEIFADLTDRFWLTFGVALLIGMWALLLVNTIAGWVGNDAVGWSREILSFMIAWSIIIMAGPVARRDEHIKVTFLPEKLLGEKRAKDFMQVADNLVGLALCTYLTLHSFRFVYQTYELHRVVQSSKGWEYPLWIIRSGIFWGFLFSSIYYFERTVRWTRTRFIKKKLISDGNSVDKPMNDVHEGAS